MRWRIGLAIIVILVAGLGLASWQLSPKVISISPSDDALHGSQPIVITFSRPMDPESVKNSLI